MRTMTKATFRRWVVRFIELCIYMTVMSAGCVMVALILSGVLKMLGVG